MTENPTTRLCIYHWLPLADNMLPDIEQHLRDLPEHQIHSLQFAAGAVEYNSECDVKRNSDQLIVLPFQGKIDSEGFCQHVAELAPIHGLPLSESITVVLQQFREHLKTFLFYLAPAAIRNKLAVMEEGIVSYTHFYFGDPLGPTIDIPAQAFLATHNVAIIVLTEGHESDLKAGLSLPALDLRDIRPSLTDATCVFPNTTHDTFLFYSREYQNEERLHFDGVFHKFSCLLNLTDFARRAISILKDTRDHVVPLRRQLAIALQRNTEEHFSFLTEMKKYLTYASVKLPIVEKVRNHLIDTARSDQFVEINSLSSDKKHTDEFGTMKMLSLCNDEAVHPLVLHQRLGDDLERLTLLYKEGERELTVLSNEVSQVLQGSLSSEGLHLSARKLDTEQASLELDRAGKNRANALKALSIVLAVNVAATIADWFRLGIIGRPLLAILLTGIAAALIEWDIRRKSRYFRLVIPLNWKVNREGIRNLVDNRTLKRSESNGSRRIRTWEQQIYAGYPGVMDAGDMPAIKHPIRPGAGLKAARSAIARTRPSIERMLVPLHGRKYIADITVDYEQRGFLHSVTVDIEASSISIDSRSVVTQILTEFAHAKCLADERERKSLLAEAFSRLDLFVDASLTSLNWVLTQDPASLRRVLQACKETTRDHNFVSELGREKLEEYRDFARHVVENREDYKEWLGEALRCTKESEILESLLGHKMLSLKEDIIAALELVGSSEREA